MSYEEEFDSIMRAKSEEMEYSFEEAHWQKASQLITRHRTGGREVIRSLAWSAAVVVAGGVATLLWFSPGMTDPAKAVASATSGETVVRAEVALSDDIGVKAQLHEGARSAVAVAPVSGGETGEQVNAAVTSGNSLASKDASGRAETKQRNSRDNVNGMNMPASEAGHQQKEIQPANPVAEFNPVDFTAAGLKVELLAAKQLPLDEDQPIRHARLTNIRTLGSNDDYVAKKRTAAMFLDVEAGGAFWTGWQSDGSHNGRGINWFAGADVGRKLGKHWQVSAGLQVFNFAHLDAPFYSAGAISYGFGSVTNNTVITTEEMRYFGLPVRVGYTFAGGGQLRAGIIGAQLWHATNRLETNTARNSEMVESNTDRNHKLYDGMNQQLFMLTAGYGVRLSERVFAGVDVVYGLTDLFSERTYLRRVERPLMIRAGIKYRIAGK